MSDLGDGTPRRTPRHGPEVLSPQRFSRSLEETVSESNRQPLRPILTSKSRSVDSSPVCSSQQRRNVSFQLPERRDSAANRMAALAQRVKQLALSAAASPSARRQKQEKTTKRILRQPVVHVYLRGTSGLPTQRVPLSAVYRGARDFRASSVS